MEPGTVLAGKYRLVSVLGQGGMGSVWRAEHLGLNAPVAVKLIDAAIANNSEALGRFHREAQAAAALRSPHVVQILDHGVDQEHNAPFIVMELMEGESLGDRLDRVGALSPAQTSNLLAQVARALTRAHEAGIVHRDLKPDNIFLVNNYDDEIAKVLDFGVAKASPNSLHPGMATRTGMVMGTPFYMSPEQISGSKDVDHRTDLWALAVIVAQCLTGRLLFTAETIGGLTLKICTEPIPSANSLGAVPSGFDQWLAKGVARTLSERFSSAVEMATSFKQICAGASLLSGGHVSGVAQTVHSTSDVLQAAHPASGASNTNLPAVGVSSVSSAQLASGGVRAESVGPLSNTTTALMPRKHGRSLLIGGGALGLGLLAVGALLFLDQSDGDSEHGEDIATSATPTAATMPEATTATDGIPKVTPTGSLDRLDVSTAPDAGSSTLPASATSATAKPPASLPRAIPKSRAPLRTVERTPPAPLVKPVVAPRPKAPPKPRSAFDGILDDRH